MGDRRIDWIGCSKARKGARGRRTAGGAALVLTCVLAVVSCGNATPTPSPSPTFSAPPPTAQPPRFPTPVPSVSTTPAFRTLVKLKDYAGSRYFGTSVLAGPLRYDDRYASLVEGDFSSITPEYAMRWSFVEPVQGEYSWEDADDIVTWAASRHIAIRGFTLAWDQGLPAWLTNGTFDQATLTQILHDHVTNEVAHFAGKVAAWDVATEPLAPNGTVRSTIWSRTLGKDWVARVLQWARAADPAAKLYINSAGIESLGIKSDAFYALARTLKAEGVPLDGIGIEGHFDAGSPYPQGLPANIQRFGALGLEVAITQLDVRMHNPPLEKEPPRQIKLYPAAVRACFTQPACVGVTVWSFTDRYSWVPRTFPGYGLAALFNDNESSKPELLVPVKQAMLP